MQLSSSPSLFKLFLTEFKISKPIWILSLDLDKAWVSLFLAFFLRSYEMSRQQIKQF